jgi:transcriptional regulator NrdR family protein
MYRCPKCQTPALTKQTRRYPGTGEVRRRYHCPAAACKHRFSTVEKLDLGLRLQREMDRLLEEQR